jgi:hypothetical protein
MRLPWPSRTTTAFTNGASDCRCVGNGGGRGNHATGGQCNWNDSRHQYHNCAHDATVVPPPWSRATQRTSLRTRQAAPQTTIFSSAQNQPRWRYEFVGLVRGIVSGARRPPLPTPTSSALPLRGGPTVFLNSLLFKDPGLHNKITIAKATTGRTGRRCRRSHRGRCHHGCEWRTHPAGTFTRGQGGKEAFTTTGGGQDEGGHDRRAPSPVLT